MTDRQVARWADARRRHHEAVQRQRDAQRELDAAAAELVVAGAALAERVRILDRSADLALRTRPVKA